MKLKIASSVLLLACLAAWNARAAGEAKPVVELTATSTNLVVTEETTVKVRLWLPPLKDELANIPPLMTQRPPHMVVPFWEPAWKSASLSSVDPKITPPVAGEARSRDTPVFTLNEYVTDGIASMMRSSFGRRDPFASFFDDDDFGFGRSLGPRRATFPFESRRVERNGVNGWEFTASSIPYRAIAPGKTRLGGVSVKVPIITGVRSSRDRFGRAAYVPTIQETALRTADLTIEVVEPPSAGRPVAYCGAISSNLVAISSLNASVCTAGDPLVLTLDVSGATDLSAVHAPSFSDELNQGGVFRLDEASLRTETLAASRRFTWHVRALKAGTVEFPSLPISYYDPSGRAYRTCRTASIPVQVKAGVQAALGMMEDDGNDEETFPLPDGIDLDARGAAREPLLPHLAVALLLFILPPLVFLVSRIAPPLWRHISASRAASRRASAYKVCRRALASRDEAKRMKAIRDFFETRYGVNGAAITAVDARRLMSGDYSPEEVAAVADALAAADRTNFSVRKTVVALIAVCAASCSLFAGSPEFTYRRASSLATRAADEAGFRAAAQAYVACAQDGASNPTLFSNLGSCLLMGGNARGALAAFACAERRGGETATTCRGVRAAVARLKNDPRADPPLARAMFAPHVRLPLDMRLLLAAVFWAIAWLAALLPRGFGARRTLMWLFATAFLVCATSCAISFAGEHLAAEVIYAGR
ncbi:MAG: BatD family protein [Kiritimatiellae bacterium]|nr:BatD family protein [Kiritimatiellia bacterium]